MKNIFKILVVVVLVSFFRFTGSVEAVTTCNSANLFLSSSSDVGWGETPDNLRWSAVSTAPNTSIRMSLAGEDGCAGRTGNFQILNSAGGILNQFDGVLKLGRHITGSKYQLYYDWNSNLPIGNGYKFQVRSIGLVAAFSTSINVLNVEQINQACHLSNVVVVSPAPGGTTFGTPVGIRVTGQDCEGWGATMNIYRYFTTGISSGTRQFVTTLSEQKFPADNQLVFSWTPQNNPGKGNIFSYQAEAVAGSQKLDSNVFVVDGTGGYGAQTNKGNQNTQIKTTTTNTEKKTSLDFPNPLNSGDLNQLIQNIYNWIFYLAIPIAVAVIVISGIMMMASQGDPGKFTTARKMLLWAVIGLAVLFIGSGFTKLIQSIINLKNR